VQRGLGDHDHDEAERELMESLTDAVGPVPSSVTEAARRAVAERFGRRPAEPEPEDTVECPKPDRPTCSD
jgi:hypothetical protein